MSLLARLQSVQQKATDAVKQAQAQQQTANAPKQIICIDNEKLQKVWNAFSAALPQADMYLRTIMERPPHAQGDTIFVDIINDSQKTICENAELISHLRRELGNPNITLRPNLIAQVQQQSRPYSSTEKLNSMLADNPHLQDLITKFGLDFA